MKIIKNIGWIIVMLVVLTALVLVRTFNHNLFTRDASDAVAATGNNTIALAELNSLQASYTIVELDDNSGKFEQSISIPYALILEKTNRMKLESLEGSIYLFSESIETSAQAWVILNQLGFDNVFILSNEQEPEALKYKFQPDTSVGPEF